MGTFKQRDSFKFVFQIFSCGGDVKNIWEDQLGE